MIKESGTGAKQVKGINKSLPTALLCLVVSVAYMICARTYPGLNPAYLDISAAFFPTVVAGIMIVCSVVMLIKAIVKPEIREPLSAEEKKGYLRGILTILTCLIYVLIFKPVGYIVSSMLAVFALMLIFGNRRWKIIIPITIVFPILLYLAFSYGLKIVLPAGILSFLK